ncbi:hypothetical protein AQUCO_00400353v1 [Aquilegia coerulea]|uniref:Uncharacterized protein n=1 Tax=Aquilegia coerulea TaxID=218851 RepID=A0A2G5EUI7_AQUCA|nr:hypothetical protein AQUCO_00400353v1 [Aquilegia coerulea]
MDAKNVKGFVVIIVFLLGMLVGESTAKFSTCYNKCYKKCVEETDHFYFLKCSVECLKCVAHSSSSAISVSDAENNCKLGCAFPT